MSRGPNMHEQLPSAGDGPGKAPSPVAWDADARWLLDEQADLRGRRILVVAVLTIVVLVVWAHFAELDEVTRGQGRVIPSSQVQIVQAVDGGVVQQVYVQEGSTVRKGETLLHIDPTRFVSNLRESRSQLLALRVKSARLQALVNEQPFVAPADAIEAVPSIVNLESRLYTSQREELAAQVEIAQRQLEQRREERSEISAKRRQVNESLGLAERELAVTEPLVDRGAVSEVEVMRLRRDVARLNGERGQAEAQIRRLESAIVEAQQKIQEVKLNFRNRLRAELSETLAMLDSLQESQSGLEDRVDKAEVFSPVRGAVKRLLVNTQGAVVQPGQPLVEIVPLDDALVLEANIAPKDIAFLRPGMPAVVKFTAYDFAIYGALNATVEHISADSVVDEEGNAFFLIRLRTDKAEIGDGLPIIPGMVAEVDVLTGRKSVLSYLAKPILRAKSRAMTER